MPTPPVLAPVYTGIPNRWKFDGPDYHRYGPPAKQPYVRERLLDPYNLNKLKGDYPIIGNNIFLNINLESNPH